MFKWLHHLLNPHCSECRDEEICESCETLRSELIVVRAQNESLIKTILEIVNPKPIAQSADSKTPVPVTGQMTWRMRQQLLEAGDRERAKVLREQKAENVESTKSTEQLETELKLGEVNNG